MYLFLIYRIPLVVNNHMADWRKTNVLYAYHDNKDAMDGNSKNIITVRKSVQLGLYLSNCKNLLDTVGILQ